MIVITQPMYFPWVGFLEQIALCDHLIFYDDAQFSKGSFTNRVQIKGKDGVRWLSVPLEKIRSGQKIFETKIQANKNWKKNQINQLEDAYRVAPFKKEMLDIVNQVFSLNIDNISDLSQKSIEVIIDYYPKTLKGKKILKSSSLKIAEAGSQKVLDICKKLNQIHYITGHGAKHYLDHELFEKNNISVHYMDYQLKEYPQLHGSFTPYVSSLDLIANCGPAGDTFFDPKTVGWKEFTQLGKK